MNTEQQFVFDTVVYTNRNLLVTGQAGTGKSFLIKHIAEYLEKEQLSYQILTPTGVSAANVDGKTLHSYFNISIHTNKIHNVKNIHRDVFIIDEISMVDSAIFEKLAPIFRASRLILFGDFQQLEPVKGAFAHTCAAWAGFTFESVDLRQVMRQRHPDFIQLLGRIRCYRGLAELRKFDETPNMDLDAHTHLFGTNLERNRYNEQKLDELPTTAVVYTGTKLEINNAYYNEILKIMPLEIKLKVGARVMSVRNMRVKNKYIYNGCLGTVLECKDASVLVQFDSYPDDPVLVRTQRIPIPVGARKHYYSQIPLNIGWSFTVHKVQGITLDKVLIDCARIYNPRVLYVAVSRIRDPAHLVLRNFDPESFEMSLEEQFNRINIF